MGDPMLVCVRNSGASAQVQVGRAMGYKTAQEADDFFSGTESGCSK